MNARATGALAIAAAFLLAGLSTGARVYYLFAGLMLVMLIYGLISAVWTLLTIKTEMKGQTLRATRGEMAVVNYTLRHMSLLPPGSVRVEFEEAGSRSTTEAHVLPFRRIPLRQKIAFSHRGIYETRPMQVCVTDVFGMFTLGKRWKSGGCRVEVLPAFGQASKLELAPGEIGTEYRAAATEDTASPADVRAWQDGDSLKRVHWKLSLRRGEMLVRTYEQDARPETVILPDLSPVKEEGDLRLTIEDRICEAALCSAKAQMDDGGTVRMPLMNSRPSELTGRTQADSLRFAEALMRVSFDAGYAYEQAVVKLTSRLSQAGGIVLITAGLNAKTADWAVRLHHSGQQVRVIDVSEHPDGFLLQKLKMEGVSAESYSGAETML